MSNSFVSKIEALLGSKIDSIEGLIGGDINDSYKIEAKVQVLFLKQDQISGFGGFHSRFFDAYTETYAFNSGWRKDLGRAK
mgnify:CR=1 FL=1|tara:strand:- start:133 stop:375 length:243 start_codon:yes stop_codon:yes gene_type:complete